MLKIVLPCFNEAAVIAKVIHKIADAAPRSMVFVIDDGSSDGTSAAASAADAGRLAGVRVIKHASNKGLGETINTGLRAALDGAQPQDWIVAMDADNTHDPALVPEMIRKAEQGFDVVIASRFVHDGLEVGVSPFRKLTSRGAKAVMGALFPVSGVRDYTSGYRLYRASVLKAALDRYGDGFIREQGFTCMAEILVKLAAMPGVRFAEVPLVLRYDLKEGRSKMRVYRTILRYVILAWRLRFGVWKERAGSGAAAAS